MKIQLLSDIHLETHLDGGAAYLDSLDPEGVDLLILAGDILTWEDPRVAVGLLKIISEKYPQILYVLGNHEFWRHPWKSVQEAIFYIEEMLDKKIPNLHLLLARSSFEYQGQKFMGDTGWFPWLQKQDQWLMSSWPDFMYGSDLAESYGGLNEALHWKLIDHCDSDTIVVTHHLPSHRAIHPRWKKSLTNVFFNGAFDQILDEKEPKLWLHGHTHDPMDHVIHKTRVVCNPRGYGQKGNIPGFQEKLLIEV